MVGSENVDGKGGGVYVGAGVGAECMSVQECMRIVKEIQVGVFESGIGVGDAKSID